MFGPSWEKDLFKQVERPKPEGWSVVAQKHRAAAGVGVLAASLDGLAHYQLVAAGHGDEFRARELLGWAAANGGGDLARHPFVVKYLPDRTWQVDIAGGVSAELTLAEDVVLLAAGELHQAAGDLDAAIWVVEQAEPTTASGLSLAELYLDAERFDEAIELTDGLSNVDDPTALLVVFRARALAQLGRFDAAREAVKEALRFKARLPAIRHRALLERSEINLAVNRKAAARKDLESILAEDSTFPGLQDALAALPR